LFFTGDIQLCYDRAKIRHEQGLHLVKPDVIEEMYNNTILLIEGNFHLIDKLTLVNISAEEIPKIVAEFDKSNDVTEINHLPAWAHKLIKSISRL